MYRDKSGMEVLLAPPRIEMAEMVTVRDLERLLSLMRKVYNVMIIDTATTVDDTVLAYLDAADEVIQVLDYEWTALSRAKAMADDAHGDRLRARPDPLPASTGPTPRAACHVTR